jgi:arsenate reductase
MTEKRKVIFICSRNAARSQMAEGFLRALYGDTYEAASAGLQSSRVSRTAVRVMKEAGIDISAHRSKSIGELAGSRFDLVVSLCDEAACIPRHLLPRGNEYLHNEFPDPAAFGGDEEEILAGYRAIRDQIESWIGEQFGPRGQRGKVNL